jgi:hypothetical protein
VIILGNPPNRIISSGYPKPRLIGLTQLDEECLEKFKVTFIKIKPCPLALLLIILPCYTEELVSTGALEKKVI